MMAPRVIPVNAKFKNPLRLRDTWGTREPSKIYEQLVENGIMNEDPDMIDSLMNREQGMTKDGRDPRSEQKAKQLQRSAVESIHGLLRQLGHDSIVYLNRYEMPTDEAKTRLDNHPLPRGKLNDMSDEEFKKEFPEAVDSYIALSPGQLESPFGKGPGVGYADGGDVEGGLDQFFGPTDQSLRRRYYTGTSKDKDFTSFQESRHGTWLTLDPKEASDYAEQNDSQGYRPGPGWTYEKTNTASRVIPAYVRIENPYTGELPDFARVDNYKKAQSDWFDTLRRKGHDAWVPASSEGRLVVKLTNQGTHIKSAIGNSGDYNLSKKHLAKAEGGEVEDPTPDIANPMSIFPKPQRMFPEDARPPGGQYLAMPDKRDVTGHKAAAATIGVQPGGKPFFRASQDAVEQTGSAGRGTAMARANLFKQRAGWKWLNAPEEHGNTDTIVSVEHRGKHHYALNAHFPKGVDLARYENSPSEPRLRPTTTGNVELGPQAGSILVRGKEHPVYRHVIVKEAGGLVAPQYENPAKLAKKALMAAKKTGSRS
jgi:hypothetical protein